MKKYKYKKSFYYEGVRYYFYGDTQEEVYRKMERKRESLEKGEREIDPKRMTVKKWLDICFDQYKNNVKEITRHSQRLKADKWIVKKIGNMQLRNVRPLHCQNILNQMEGYSKDYIRKVSQLLKWMFEKAIQNNYIRENPAKYLSLPKGTKTTRRALTDYEREHLLRAADEDPRFVYFLAMLYCGCRPSEAAELQGRDLTFIKGQAVLHIRGTKSENADRYVPVADYLLDRLPHVGPFEYMFKNGRGEKLKDANRKTLWHALKRTMNISMGCAVYRNEVIPPYRVADDLVPYCLRHTFCTDLANMGIDIRKAQYLMGHSDISLTANIYTHIGDQDSLLDMAKTINNHGHNPYGGTFGGTLHETRSNC